MTDVDAIISSKRADQFLTRDVVILRDAYLLLQSQLAAANERADAMTAERDMLLEMNGTQASTITSQRENIERLSDLLGKANALARIRLARIDEITAERDAVLSQLPEGMEHCTIIFEKCKIGHGWLTANNWVKHGCFICERDTAVKALEDARTQAPVAWRPKINENVMFNNGAPSEETQSYWAKIGVEIEYAYLHAPVPAQPAVVPEGLANAVLANIAAIAHCGGLAKLDNENALSNIRQLSKPWCDNTGTLRDLKNRVDAAILSTTDTEVKR